MALSQNDVKRIAHLARIEITADESAQVIQKLDRIFDLINELQSVDTTGILPMSHAQDLVLALREDKVTETDRRELYQTLAPAVDGGLYLVPKVLD